MYYNDDPYYISPEEEARLERREKIDALEKELDETQCAIFNDRIVSDAAYWKAVERAAEIREQLKTLESSDNGGSSHG